MIAQIEQMALASASKNADKVVVTQQGCASWATP
jgi:hypothetical protein